MRRGLYGIRSPMFAERRKRHDTKQRRWLRRRVRETMADFACRTRHIFCWRRNFIWPNSNPEKQEARLKPSFIKGNACVEKHKECYRTDLSHGTRPLRDISPSAGGSITRSSNEVNILWARPCPKPEFIPNSRPKGARATGLRYERRFAEFLQPYGCIHAQWFEYEDETGIHYCQPDVLMPFTKYLMAVIEVKYTLVDKAYDQLFDLYKPVVEAAYNIPVGLVAVFRNLPRRDGQRPYICNSIKEAAVQSQETGWIGLVQWLGQPVVARLDDRTAGLLTKIRQQAA